MTDLRLVTYPELAAAWGVSVRTVKRWIAEDRAQGYRVRTFLHRVNAARRYRVVRLDDAEAVLVRHHAEAVNNNLA